MVGWNGQVEVVAQIIIAEGGSVVGGLSAASDRRIEVVPFELFESDCLS